MSETKISLKLLIDSKSERVLFAEAGKEFADFLFTLLSLPVGTVIWLLSSDGMVGTLGKLYDSFKDLNDTFMQPHMNKDALLKPASSLGDSSSSPTILSLTNDTSSSNNPKVVYVCDNCHRYGSDGAPAFCPGCHSLMFTNLKYVAPHKASVGSSSEGGIVKGAVTYMVMDDLAQKPMSTKSMITMLNTFNVKQITALQRRPFLLA